MGWLVGPLIEMKVGYLVASRSFLMITVFVRFEGMARRGALCTPPIGVVLL